MELGARFLNEIWSVWVQMAPYLLLGFAVAGVLSAFISPAWVRRHLGGRGFGPVLKAALLGIPLPLCSCGVIPVAASLREHGASKGGTASFLLSTPQTGIDSIMVTWGLLGPAFAVYRVCMALLTGVLGGGLIWGFPTAEDLKADAAEPPEGDEAQAPAAKKGSAFARALQYGFMELPRSIGLHLLLGVAITGAISTFVPPDYFVGSLGSGLLPILVVMTLGIPLYVCATASVPVAVGLLHMGFSPGAALAFLITGPATNAATLTTIWKVLGKRATLIFLATVALGGLGAGVLLDVLYTATPLTPPGAGHEHHHHHGGETTGPVALGFAVLLLVNVGVALLYPIFAPRKAVAGAENMQAIDLDVKGMSCNHCVSTVTEALEGAAGVAQVEVDLKGGQAKILGRDLDVESLKERVKKAGFEASLHAGQA